MNLQGAIEEYVLATRANGVASATTKWYSAILRPLAQEHGHCPVETITAHAMRAYIVALDDRLAGDSVISHKTALRAFWRWADREYKCGNPMANIKPGQRPEREAKAITPKDFMKMLGATKDNVTGTRDKALMLFLADTGARLGGVTTLERSRLFLDDRYALVTEKGNKTRRVNFTNLTGQALLIWLQMRESESKYVFTNERNGEPLTSWGVREILRRLKTRAGVTERANPHSFRHGFAREYIKAGGDVVTLAQLLGHKSVNTTAAYYAVFSANELAEMHEQKTPLKAFLEG